MEIAPGIEINEKIHFGKPVIKNTRVPVELIIGKLSTGMSFEDIIKEYGITRQDILAALGYASKILSSEEVKAII
ncbi:MAG TPA: DUF433 domain-containing protein [Ignavibacteria bacterium]|nr:DUF433 domain-containing protein [Ignavibacteria bacterium]